MKTPVNFALVGLGMTALTALVFACGFDPPEKNPNPPNSISTGAGLNACKAGPGEFPKGDCDNSDNVCTGRICKEGTSCCKVEAVCGDPKTCLPIGDNTGKSVLDLRIRRLNVTSPPALAEPFIQNVVVNKNVDLAANGMGGVPSCGEAGLSSFNWLLQVDKTAGTLKTGGGPPQTDFNKGFCFYNKQVAAALVQSVTTKITFTGDTFESAPVGKLNVPIFVAGNINNAVILPISNATFKEVKISEGGNCVGTFNETALDKDCFEDRSACTKWKTAGALGGYLTIEEADAVDVKDLGSSLCVVLTKSTKGPDDRCPRDANGKIPLKGDYCSTSKKPGDCADSFWLAATFAASAAKITDGAGIAECAPVATPDAGTDAAPADAGTDAPKDAPSGG